MNVWIDKEHGLHYHKKGCKYIDKNYSEVNKTIMDDGTFYVNCRQYNPCFFCFNSELNRKNGVK
jgi:hypothetical protein